MSLATDYRPRYLEEVVGQDSIKKILEHEFKTNNIKDQYLLVGKSGSGKTTISRIIAHQLNADMYEIDAASNNSAEDMRRVLAGSSSNISGNKQVIIIDECHALSSTATQVLLKTLERPNRNTVFIMCTTEGDKVIETIRSRCEVLTFSAISKEEIISRLKYICMDMDIEYEPRSLWEIAKSANGSLRQAISILELVSGEKVTIKSVRQALGADTYDTAFNLIYAICDKDIRNLIRIVDEIDNPVNFMDNFFIFLLDVLIYKKTNNIRYTKLLTELEDTVKEFNVSDLEKMQMLVDELFELESTCRNNPILKQLFLSRCVKVVDQI